MLRGGLSGSGDIYHPANAIFKVRARLIAYFLMIVIKSNNFFDRNSLKRAVYPQNEKNLFGDSPTNFSSILFPFFPDSLIIFYSSFTRRHSMEWITPRTKWTRQRPEWSRPDYARIMSVGGKFSSFLFPSTVWNAAKFNFNIKRTPSSIRGTGHNVERIHIFSPVTAKVVTQFSCRCHISKVSSNIKSSNLLFNGDNNDFLAAKYCVWLTLIRRYNICVVQL